MTRLEIRIRGRWWRLQPGKPKFKKERTERFKMNISILENIPRFYTALAEWCACMMFCLNLERKISNKKFAIYSAIALIVQSIFLMVTGKVAVFLWIPCMLIAIAFMYFFLRLVCQGTGKEIGYFCAYAFLLAELAASLEWQIASFFAGAFKIKNIIPQGIILIVVYGITFFIAHKIQKLVSGDILVKFEITNRELIMVDVIVLTIFTFSNLSFITKKTPFSVSLTADICYVRTLIDLSGVMMLTVYQSRINEMIAEKELSQINVMLKGQYDKYRNYQASFDMINMKYHDLKHQLAGLKMQMSDETRKEWIDTLEQELEEYSPKMQTGNHVLDTLISGKMMNVSSNKIKLTCVAEGKLLDFMHVTDICTIFGNALDNALENVSMIEDEEKRLVHLSVFAKKQFIIIQVRNYCEQELKFKDGYPITTKSDKKNHGFGLKSIRYTVEKYNGTLKFDLQKNWFELKIIIPK